MEKSHSPSGFAAGFSFGLVAGVVGYYLFGTDDGRRVRVKLADEWSQAQQFMQKRGVLDQSTPVSLGAMVNQLKNQLLAAVELDLSPAESQKSTSSHRSHRRQYRRHRPTQFKGV